MRITRYTDYSLRVLIYLAPIERERLVTIQDIAQAYDISRNHLMKVVQELNQKGYIETVRGKNGGMRLSSAPSDINIGVLVREMEPDMNLVECFGASNECAITPVCGLRNVLSKALEEFLSVLDGFTLADIVPDNHQPQLIRLLQIETTAPA